MLFLIVFGGICFWDLGISHMPDVDFPNVNVSVTYEGASPEIIESDVIDPIEDAVMSVQGVKEISSSARQGRATLNVEFDLDRDIDVAVNEVQTKIAQAQRLLPREIDPPIVTKTNADDNPIMFVMLSGHVPYQDLVMHARYGLRDKFQTLKGVGEIMMGGFRDRNMRVWLKLEEMEARGMTVEDVLSALKREHVEIPAGRIESGTREMNVRSMGEAPTVEQFRDIVVAWRNGAPVFLNQIAVIEDGLEDRRRMARALGVPAVGMGIKKQYGANAVEVARLVRARVEELQGKIPPGMTLEINSDSTIYIEDSIQEMQFTLVLSVILTALVCLVFLGSWSSTFNILLSIPTSIVGSFILIYFLGFTLNMFTLLALSLAVGIVVDDAIMVLENIVRHREKGEERVKAASRGARQITLAAMAATLAILAIFVPIAFLTGLIGKFLYQFGVTISVAVALSLLEALTLTPMRCSQMLSSGTRATAVGRGLDRAYGGLASAYRATLIVALKVPWLVVLLALGIFGASLLLFRQIRQETVPPQDMSMLRVTFQTPVGSSIDYTDSKLREMEQYLLPHKAVNRYFAAIGGWGGGEVDSGMVFMTLVPREERPGKMTQQQFMDEIRRRFNAIPGVKAYVSDMSMRGLTPRGSMFPIQFIISGPDWEQLGQLSETFMEKMRDSGLMTDVNSNYFVGMPELKILPDRKRAADLGVSAQTIGDTLYALVGGVRAAKFQDGGHRFDVRVRLLSDQRSRPDDVRRLFVRNREGKLVRLSEVVRIHEAATVQTITRFNRARAITLQANLAAGASQKTVNERIAAIAAEILPSGYGIEITGSSRLFEEAGLAFAMAIGLGVIVAYMVLASQFNSYVHPLLVLLAMPFSVTGAFVAMWWADVSLNLYSMIGLILLMGIVKKNSILLVEFTNQMREHGRGVREALIEACPIRLRPILMTSFSTVAAAIPPALALGPGAETRIPMAIVVIGGILLSTLFTLYVVPCAYRLLPGRVREHPEEDALEPAGTGLRANGGATGGP
jgi:HAE1 family hydrophobic/amphiphilic exporter-1